MQGPKFWSTWSIRFFTFEGEATHAFRILRAVKNRFGSTNEIGVFEMEDFGLVEVTSPSEFFLSERAQPTSGSVVMPSLEGSRPILIELQALVVPTNFGMPRRTAEGEDANRDPFSLPSWRRDWGFTSIIRTFFLTSLAE